MIAETLLGLAVFAAGIGSGYLYVRATKRYEPRPASGWHAAFSEFRPDEMAVWVTVELRDGRRVAGSLRDYSWGEGQPRELLIWEPIAVRLPTEERARQLKDKFLVIRDDEVVYIAGRYMPGRPPQS